MPTARAVHGIVDRLEHAFLSSERAVGQDRDRAIEALSRVLDEVTTELQSLTL